MIKITIEGPQGSGKTRLGHAIMAAAAEAEKSSALLDEGDFLEVWHRPPDVVILCRQGEPRLPLYIRRRSRKR